MIRLLLGVMALLFLAGCSTTAVKIDLEKNKVEVTTQTPFTDDLGTLMNDMHQRMKKACKFHKDDGTSEKAQAQKIKEIIGVAKGILGLFPVHSFTLSGTCKEFSNIEGE